nr:MAG TPA: hypothetical protein [Caudoviricetes sp.]
MRHKHTKSTHHPIGCYFYTQNRKYVVQKAFSMSAFFSAYLQHTK